MIRGALVGRVGHERDLVRAHLADKRDELRRRVAFDVVFDPRRQLVPDQRGELDDVSAPDMALIGARVHRDAMGAGMDDQARRIEHARIADVALIAQQRYLVEVDAELRLDGCAHHASPAPDLRA